MTLKPDDATLYKKILDLPILECNISGKKLLAQGYKSGLEIGNILKEYKENMIQEQYDLCFKGFTS
jgi:hypothetical protein